MPDLYATLDRGLGHTEDIDDALFVDRDGRLRTNPVRKPPPGGTPAHIPALLEVREMQGYDSPLYAALDEGFVRIRTVRTASDSPSLSLTASVPLTAPQIERLRVVVAREPALSLDATFAGERVWSIERLPLEPEHLPDQGG